MGKSIGVLFEIYRADEISASTRIKLIKKMGRAINDEYGMNITEPIVYELVLVLDPNDEIKNNEHFKEYA